MTGAEVLVLAVLGLILLIGFFKMIDQEEQLKDPKNTEVVYLSQLPEVCVMGDGGKYRLSIFRQSGNSHQNDKTYGSLETAIKAATSTFKRAKIDYVVITNNSESTFGFRRPFHAHGGRQEGKKVERAEISKITTSGETTVSGLSGEASSAQKDVMEPGIRYTVRDGQLTPTDSAFDAWTSRDLEKMVSELETKTTLVDRHFLLMTIVDEAYKLRKNDTEMRALCQKVSEMHLAEFSKIRPALEKSLGGVLPRVPTFQKYATLLTEQDEFDRAVEVCEIALSFGLHDGTKSGFEGRIARIKKKAMNS
ncbi:hypothetical protein ACTXGQ_18810 [Marinobacter sp. 1Y8]